MINNKTKIISFLILILLLFTGFKSGFSVLKNSITKINNEQYKRDFYGSVSVVPANYISPFQYKTDILKYKLDINLFPDKKHLEGEAVLTGIILDKNLPEIHLNFYDNLTISSLKLNEKETSYIHNGTRLIVSVEEIINDTFKLNISYSGTPKKAGLSAFVFGSINDRSVVYNLNEPDYASTWFPCNDYPEDKALLDIKITNDSSQISVSNGILIDEYNSGDKKTYHWKTIYPISTYLICIYSSEYVNFSDTYISLDKQDTMDLQYYVFPEHLEDAKKDFSIHPRALKFFSEKFGEYPFIKEKYGVALFLWQQGAMEHQTISGIGSNFINGRRFFDDIYIHELAHQWWGNAVGPATWKDIWLNEGFATYSEVLYSEFIAGSKALQSNMLGKFQDFSGRLYDPQGFLFSQIVYDKGAWVLHMLRFETGDSVFFKILREYFDTYKYKNASTNDFQKLSEKISGKNLGKFFDQWVYSGEEIIKLIYSWNSEKKNNEFYTINLNLKQVQDKYKDFNFSLQVLLEFDDKTSAVETIYLDKRQKDFEINTGKKPVKIVPDPDSWLLADIKMESE